LEVAIMTAISAADVTTRRSFLEVWVITLGHTMTHWYPATFYLLLPLIGNELGLNYSEIGAILTCQYLVGAISNIPGGLIVDMVGRRTLLMALSLLWVGVPYLLMGFTHAYWLILLCSALIGIGNNLWHPSAIPLLAQRFPDRRGLAVAFHGMGGNVGDSLAPLAAGVLLTVLSWRNVVILNVIPALIVSLLIVLYLGRSADQKEKSDDKTSRIKPADTLWALKTLLKNRTVVMMSTSSAFRSMTQTALLTFLPVFLANQMGYSLLWIGGCIFALQAAGFIAAPIAGHLSDRMGRRRIIMSSMAMTAIVLLLMATVGGSTAFVLLISFLGFFLFAIRAVMQAWMLDATPSNMGGTSIGILFGVQAIGAAIGPALGGILADRYGLTATFYFLALTIIVANFLIFFTPTEANVVLAARTEPS
jgi:MFS transporter, FSR family, fosmidomycin resistance protein